MIICISSYW